MTLVTAFRAVFTRDGSPPRHARFLLAGLTVFTTAVMTSCADHVEREPAVAVASAATFTEDALRQWQMPLDDYLRFEPELHDYVESLLVGECLLQEGYEWPVPGRSSDFSWPANFNQIGHRLFDRTIAEQWGYHDAPAPDPQWAHALEAFSAFASTYTPSPGFSRDYDSCLRSAQYSYTSTTFADDYNFVVNLKNDALDAAHDDEGVRAAVVQWKACVQDVLPGVDNPRSVLSDQTRAARFGLWGAERSRTAASEEKRVAVVDATCQESSGYSRALYVAQELNERTALTANKVELDRIREAGSDHAEALLEMFGRLAPAPGSTL